MARARGRTTVHSLNCILHVYIYRAMINHVAQTLAHLSNFVADNDAAVFFLIIFYSFVRLTVVLLLYGVPRLIAILKSHDTIPSTSGI